jgi:hypothetical protein
MADGETKAISAVRLHDRVRATDPVTKITGGREVTQLHRNQDNDLTDVHIRQAAGGVATIHTTREHPFWDATRGAWTDAADLAAGDRLGTARHHTATVAAVSSFTGDRPMYNLTVEDLHTYYVLAGRTPVLVHNTPCKIKLTAAQQVDLAKFLGYTKKRGNYGKASVFEVKKPGPGQPKYISRDIDQHEGGSFKGADKVEDLWKKETRKGTYDLDIVDGQVRGLVRISD